MENRGSLSTCALCCCSLGLCGSSIAFLVFSLIFLIGDRYVCGDGSPLWVYGIVAMVYTTIIPCTLPFLSGLSLAFVDAPSRNTNEGKLRKSEHDQIWTGMYNLGFLIYGAYTIFTPGVVCDDMKNSGLWIWAQVVFASSVVGAFMQIMLFMFYKPILEEAIQNIQNAEANNRPSVEAEPMPHDVESGNKATVAVQAEARVVAARSATSDDEMSTTDIEVVVSGFHRR
jgi:hypothetical protein